MFKMKKLFEKPTHFEKGVPYYIVENDGIYVYIRHHGYVRKKLLTAYHNEKKLPMFVTNEGYSEKNEQVSYGLPYKMPFEFFVHMANFYKTVHQKDKTEANTHLFYIEQGYTLKDVTAYLKEKGVSIKLWKQGRYKYNEHFFAYTPKQVNTSTLTVFNEDEVFATLASSPLVSVAMETHSHHVMQAFWSGTDNQHQKDNYYYGVMGNIYTKDDFLVKQVTNGEPINLTVNQTEEIIDYPTFKLASENSIVQQAFAQLAEEQSIKYHGVIPFNENLFPQKWLKQIIYTD